MQEKRTIEQIKGWFSRESQDENQDLGRLRQQLVESHRKMRQMSEQLRTNRLEAARLDALHRQHLAEREAKISELKRELYEVSAGRELLQSGEFAKKNRATALYLDLMKRTLTNWIYRDEGELYQREPKPFEELVREEGRDWPLNAHTMIGLKRLNNIEFCVEDVITKGVPGDLIETGVWRGGATIFMRAILEAYGVRDRRVWVADSFEGLPKPDAERYPLDAGDINFAEEELAVSVEEVRANFERYGLLDERVRFVKGWFRDTLPTAPIEKLSVIRLDGDWYESTMDGLVHLYPKLSVGGYLIVDDYGCVPACRQAVHDYRDAQGITDEICSVDWTGVYWQRTA